MEKCPTHKNVCDWPKLSNLIWSDASWRQREEGKSLVLWASINLGTFLVNICEKDCCDEPWSNALDDLLGAFFWYPQALVVVLWIFVDFPWAEHKYYAAKKSLQKRLESIDMAKCACESLRQDASHLTSEDQVMEELSKKLDLPVASIGKLLLDWSRLRYVCFDWRKHSAPTIMLLVYFACLYITL